MPRIAEHPGDLHGTRTVGYTAPLAGLSSSPGLRRFTSSLARVPIGSAVLDYLKSQHLPALPRR